MRLTLLHSPFLTTSSWGKLPAALEELGHDVDLIDADGAATPREYAKAAQRQLTSELTLLVAHSGAGPLVPIVAARRDWGRILGAVFLDATLPGLTGESRLTALHRRRPDVAADLARRLYAGESFPDPATEGWSEVEVRPRDLAFFTEPIPVPSTGWGDLGWAFLQTSSGYEAEAAVAEQQGRPVLRRDLGHFAAMTAPDEVAAAVSELADRLTAV